MNKAKLFILGFILVALIQIFVPLITIIQREDVLNTGKEFKFRTAAVDPYDLFRGKYITLNYKNDNIPIEKKSKEWERGKTIYVVISQDKEGFAIIESVSKREPSENIDFIKAKVDYVRARQEREKICIQVPFRNLLKQNFGYLEVKNYVNKLYIKYPFKRFYMDEFKAYKAEVVHRRANRERREAYALIRLKKGVTVLKDVMIDGESIKEVLENLNNKK